jgi:hypothetical protein
MRRDSNLWPKTRRVRRLARSAASIAVISVIGFSCASTPQVWNARLYPTAGPYFGSPTPLTAEFVYNQYGHGPARFRYPDGNVCSGEYNTEFGGTTSSLVLWNGATVQTVAGSTGPNTAYGSATGTCSDGTLLECAYSVNRVSGHGKGVCRDSHGGHYNLHF